ncbi:hypothetical protein NQ318_009547 [Aromia moschata]|uniref:GIY-YIG domain-containing protein n=1 Tax=Aromia moschata TaxID=1265417 RepID=A0AAV8Y9X3_9CUCU|nr:hypothetical protein NQ318_009547 [Aromia moschata]
MHVLRNFPKYVTKTQDKLGCNRDEASFLTMRECILKHKDVIRWCQITTERERQRKVYKLKIFLTTNANGNADANANANANAEFINPALALSHCCSQTLLGNPKDKINNNEKSGIYEISCKDCDQKYIGQTKRSILTRFKEHMAHLKYGRTEKSCVAQHAFDNNHRIDINNLKLIRNVTNSRLLDAFESLEIIKCNNSMNKDNGPIPTSPLFALINKDSYGSVNRGNKFGINSANANLVGETRVEKSVVVRCFVENVQFFVSTPKVPVPTPKFNPHKEFINFPLTDEAGIIKTTALVPQNSLVLRCIYRVSQYSVYNELPDAPDGFVKETVVEVCTSIIEDIPIAELIKIIRPLKILKDVLEKMVCLRREKAKSHMEQDPANTTDMEAIQCDDVQGIHAYTQIV